jgi:hypothetical protein
MALQLGGDLDQTKNVSLRDNGDGTLSVCVGATETVRFKSDTTILLKGQTQTVLKGGSGVYVTPPNCVRIRVRMVGGGGGGSAYNVATDGSASTFGIAFLFAGGGTKAIAGSSAGLGGTASYRFPAIGFANTGNGGQAVDRAEAAAYNAGMSGGAGPFGGAGHGATNAPGHPGSPNSGSGGGGGGSNGEAGYGGGGGGAGGHVDVIINNPDPSYPYSVGAGGLGGTGPYISTAGDGAAGIIVIDEFYI